MQLLLVPRAVHILPTRGDIAPTLAHRLIAVKTQATFVEAARFGTNRLVGRVDDCVEREFGYLTRIVLVVTDMVLDHGERDAKPDLRGGKTDTWRFEHGGSHRLDEFGEGVLAQLPVVAARRLAQHRLTHLDDWEDAFTIAGSEQTFNRTVQPQIDT